MAARVETGRDLAKAAYNKLQFDFPLVSQMELSALVSSYRRAPLAEAAVLLDRSGALLVCREALTKPRYEGQPESSSQPQPTANEADGYRLHAASGEAANGQQAAAAQAEQEDEDDFEYKDMDVPAPPSSTARRSRRPATTESVATAGAAGPAAATQKLLQLLRHVSYALVADGGVWREMDMGGDVVACLGLVQRHEKADELQGITLVLLALIIDRLGASPADMDLLSQSWTALGVAGEPKAACTRTVGRATSPAIPAACRAALSLATALPGRLQTASAHRQLWSQIHEGLLPTLARCLEMLAACKGPDFRGEAGTDLALICCILEFLVMQAPAGAEIGDDLLQAGAFRALVLLFASHTAHPAAVPLRRAMLLLCAASARLGAWAAAVPAFKQRLSSEDFLECGDAALHGAGGKMAAPTRGCNGRP
ncbi:hypothetical protein WJX72_002371 [[Myrmecia] bisecta]|uniref:Neurochondrin n=1 Tax=[Myrmecia] bisecta TaxID=41462 RepID=A0AAW1P659_9CHLO